jgi:GDP-mannose 6-dehydrogenase
VSFISVGTPSAPDGSVSMGAVRAVLADIGRAMAGKPGHTVVMRSTVPPGTAEEVAIPILERESGLRAGSGFRYYSNPEFLREGSSVRDFHAPPFTLIGAADGDDAAVVREIYATIDAAVHVAPYRVSESAKYLSNVFHAVKLAFANEAGAVLAAHGVDARAAFRLFCEDRVLNISTAYLRPGFAFGGSCLPKDIRSFLSLAASRDVPAPFLRQVLPGNQAIIDRAFDMVAAHGRQPVALFGLAFKPGTDDLRESPFVLLAEKLLGRGYDLRIHDRHVQTARLTGANRAYIEREIPHLERLLAATPAEALEGTGLAIVGHVGAEDRPALFAALAGKRVLDLAGIAELAALPGVDYEGFCW